MSGFEVAGIVLGAFPIALHLLDDYREVAKRAGLWYRIRLEHAKCRNDVEFQRVTLNSHMRQLILPLLVDDEKTNQLLSEPGGESWKEPSIESLLKDRLGQIYDLYFAYIRGMQETMLELNTELKVDSKGVEEQLKNLKTSVTKEKLKTVATRAGVEFQIYKIKFSNGEAKRKELLSQLQEYNDKLEKLLSTTDRDAQLKKQLTAVQHKTAIDATLCSFWKQATKLFQAVASAWNCPCARDQHLTKLLLQHRTSRKTEFDILFSARRTSGWQIQHTRISEDDGMGPETASTTLATGATSEADPLPIRQPAHRQKPTGIFKSAMRTKKMAVTTTGGQQHAIPQPSVTISRVQIANASSSSTTHQVSLTLGIQPILSLCLSLQQPIPTGATKPICYGYLTAADDDNPASSCNKFYLHTLSRQQTDSLFTISLDQILRDAIPVTRKQRYILALTLASSFLQLLDTPWLPVTWKKSDIVFIAQDPSHKPYIKRESLTSPIQQQQSPTPPSSAKITSLNRSLDRLGIVLLELCFGTCLENQPCRRNWPCGATEAEIAGFDFLAARDWQCEVEGEAGLEYSEAVAWCFGSVTRYDRWREDMLKAVVEPLSRCGGWVAGGV